MAIFVINLPTDINKLCRTCMNVAPEDQSSFDYMLLNREGQPSELCQLLERLTPLNIGAEDGLPQTICEKCVVQLQQCQSFVRHCTEVDSHLRELPLLNSMVDPMGFSAAYKLSKKRMQQNAGKTLTELFNESRGDEERSAQQISVKREGSLKTDNVITESLDPSSLDSEALNLSDVLETEQIKSVLSVLNAEKQENAEHATSPQPAQVAKSGKEALDTGDSVQLCVLCYKQFKTLSELTLHFIKHGLTESTVIKYEENTIFCEVCGEVFGEMDLLEKHHQISHERLTWTCELCDLNFANEVELLTHNKNHVGFIPKSTCWEENLRCPLCIKQLPNKHLLTEHIAVHLMKKFRCRLCTSCYCTHAAYMNHLQIHNYKHECKICGGFFVSKANLQIHVKGVHESSTARCNVCRKVFSSISSLRMHKKVHYQEKRYLCECCPYRTTSAGDLQDANECWTELVRVLQQNLLAKQTTSTENNNKSLVDQYFSGTFDVEWKCVESEDEPVKNTKEQFLQLSCFISQDVRYMLTGLRSKLQENITKLSSSLERDAVYTKTSKVSRLPGYLTIQFVRFQFKKQAVNAKILKDVKFPLDFDAYELCSPELQEKLAPVRSRFKELEDAQVAAAVKGKVKTKGDLQSKDKAKVQPYWFEDDIGSNNSGYYTLQAVLTHKGRTSSSGHYVSWIRQSDDSWFKCDDDKVTPVTTDEILKLSGGGEWHIAYVLLYGPKLLNLSLEDEAMATD